MPLIGHLVVRLLCQLVAPMDSLLGKLFLVAIGNIATNLKKNTTMPPENMI